mgnify:CR=1 FL=1
MLTRTYQDSTSAAAALAPVVEVSGLCRTVSADDGAALRILDDVSFRILAGEAVAIVGASGSGKSTLLGLLAGLDEPSSGAVHIRGQDLFALDEDGRAALRGACVGFVFQSFQLLPALTALENVMLPLELGGMSARAARQQAMAALEAVGLADMADRDAERLSGGEQQRVAVARAFAPQPALVLADEPTGNLDVATGDAVIELMFSLNAEAGTTLVLVTHDNALAARCGRTLRLAAGRLVEG